MQKSTENVAKSPTFCTLTGNRGRRIDRRCLNFYQKLRNNGFCGSILLLHLLTTTDFIAALRFRTLDYNKQSTVGPTLTRGTCPDKVIFHSRQMQTCPTTYRRDDTPQPIPYPYDWSRGLLLRQNRLSFPTRAVLPDNGRRDDTLPPTHFRKLLSKWQFRAIFIFCRIFIIFWGGGHVPPAPRLVRLCSLSLKVGIGPLNTARGSVQSAVSSRSGIWGGANISEVHSTVATTSTSSSAMST